MDKTFLTTALVLDKQPWGEKDSKVFLYSGAYGRLDLVARGTRKLESKLNAHLEPFNTIELMVIKGRQWDYVGSVLSLDTKKYLKCSLHQLTAAGQLAAAVKKYIEVGDADTVTYNLLDSCWSILNRRDVNAAVSALVSVAGEIKLLEQLGWSVDPESCQLCSSELKNGAWQRVSGELICAECAKMTRDDFIKISPDTLKTLAVIYKTRPERWLGLNWFTKDIHRELVSIKQRLVFYQN